MGKIFLPIFALLLASCKAGSNVDMLSEFSENVSGQTKYVDFPKDSILNPIMIACTDSVLVLSNIFQKTVLSLYNFEKDMFLGHYLRKGTGIDEINLMMTLKFQESGLHFWDPNKRLLSTIDIKEPHIIKNSVCLKKSQIPLFKVYRINENYSMASGAFPNYPFAIFDNRSDSIISYFGVYPFNEKDNSLTDMDKALACQWYSHYDPSNKMMVTATLSGTFICFYDLNDLSAPKLVKKSGNILPHFSKGKNGSVRFLPDNIYSFIDITGNSEYCVALFWGNTRDEYSHPNLFGGNLLLVYDWSGKPIKTIQLDNVYLALSILPNSNKVFLVRKNIADMGFVVESIVIM